ncbi:uncharacterized protein LOC128679679 [Plodia interpunctella]|uniref:uncharacterized protein LOC128679679 n=1 Tax=Plodia interpunctella TaxID=58824 RepID=UPI00236779D4|nr:uncharacterized protein LOC128679679 [Plodia interpunctella]
MSLIVKLRSFSAVLFCFVFVKEGTNQLLQATDKNYYLVSEAYSLAQKLFNQGRESYGRTKTRSLLTIDTFVDLVTMMNDQMARDLRSAVIKYYKIKYFYDFTNYVIALEEMVEITEHCLKDPVERLKEIRESFHEVIKNFQDSRHFNSVNKCQKELPDEVAAAHCILHQAVLFNETMQDSLVPIVTIKTRQHAQDINSTLYGVQSCLNDFVPRIFQQLLLDSYTSKCEFLKVINASVSDLIKDKWNNDTKFPEKWGPLVKILKEKTNDSKKKLQDPLFVTLFAANLSSEEILKTLY